MAAVSSVTWQILLQWRHVKTLYWSIVQIDPSKSDLHVRKKLEIWELLLGMFQYMEGTQGKFEILKEIVSFFCDLGGGKGEIQPCWLVTHW